MQSLQPLKPQEGVQMYLDERRGELAENTLYSHEKRLRKFVRWCDENGISNLNSLSGRDLHEYKIWRKDGEKVDQIAPDTLRTAMSTVRVFIRFCASIDAVDEGLDEKVIIPEARGRRDELLEAAHAQNLLDHLYDFEYASKEHVIFLLLWRTGMRMGALRGIDIHDYDAEAKSIQLHHRPDQGTTLKNKEAGERFVSLTEPTTHVLNDYIGNNRHDVRDDYDRRPLVTTKQGRIARQSIRRIAYYYTRPCEIGMACPSNRDPETCEYASWNEASDCPHTVSPHPIRRGSITHFLRQDVPKQVVSDRMDVSSDVIDRHYDERSERGKMEQRRRYFS